MNSWTARLKGPSTQPDSRSLTTGSYRGNNTTYTFRVPAGALVAGTNTLYIFPISGSSGPGYLSPGYSLDCIDYYIGEPRTVAVPAAPASIVATGFDGAVTLTWEASPEATNYEVLRAATRGGPYARLALAGKVTGTSYTDTGLTNGSKYYYRVRAGNCTGAGVDAAETSAIAGHSRLLWLPAW